MKMNIKSNFLWIIFGLIAVFVCADIIFVLAGKEPYLFQIMALFIPVAFLLIYVSWTLTFKRMLLFILLAACVGFVFEVYGVIYGTFFGGHYIYHESALGPMALGVPLLVPMYWAVFTYAGYSLSNSFLAWIDKHKPARKRGNAILLPLLVLMDGWFVVAIDIFLDPLAVEAGYWKWIEGGPYFGVPIGNFVGWFVISLLVTGMYRVFEYFRPQKSLSMPASISLIPVFCYGLLCAVLCCYAINMRMPELAGIGCLAMMPAVLISLILFIQWKKR